jgi:uncharacterized coiled-coil DUF342 family protein
VEELINDIEELVESGMLSQSQDNSLIPKLETAIKQLDNGKTNPATNLLEAQIKQVEAMIKSSQLPPEEGQAIIDSIEEILEQLE